MTLDEMWKENEVDKDETVEVLDADDPKKKSYFTEDCYRRDYWKPLSDKKLTEKILMDPVAEVILKKEKLASFLNKRVDPNALMVLNNIAFVYESEYDQSEVRDALEDLYSDEYAREIGDDTLGVTWVERQVVIVNISNLLNTSYEISQDPDEYRSFKEIFLQGLCSTIFHECRHLLYECNELISLGSNTVDTEEIRNGITRTVYPKSGGQEIEVEVYGNDMADRYCHEFLTLVKNENLSDLLEDYEDEHSLDNNKDEY